MMELGVDGTKAAGEPAADRLAQPCAPFIETASGGQFWYVDRGRDEEDIRIGDIAHHLAQESRFCGATKEWYSVARHSLNVLEEFRRRMPSATPTAQRLALLHDAHEAYTKDLPKPLRQLPQLAGFNELAKDVQERIERRFQAYGDAALRAEIKLIDLVLLRTEALALMPSGGRHLYWPPGVESTHDMKLSGWEWKVDQRDFLAAFLSCW